ncbi:MAG: hypothetical protein ACI4TU_01660, partial [Candidatus Cryptobacteroides sp.]
NFVHTLSINHHSTMNKKYLIILLVDLCSGLITLGQNVQINYSEKIESDIYTQLSMKVDNKTYLKIDIQADLSSKTKAILSFYQAQNGSVIKFDMGLPIQFDGISLSKEDNITIEVMMKQQRDSVSLAFAIDGQVREIMLPTNYSVSFPKGHNCAYILMETILNQSITINDEIPIFAVTGGIFSKIDIGLELPMYTQDYCGLRDKHIHPKEWVNIEGVYDYCFYTIEFQ